MLEDVLREGGDEVVNDKDTRKAISTRTVNLWHKIAKKVSV
jgi:hypothetical protein